MRKIHSKILFFFVFMLMFISHTFALNEQFINAVPFSNLSQNMVVNVEDQFHQCYPNCPWDFDLASSKVYTKLWIDDAMINRTTAYELKVEYSIKLYKNYDNVAFEGLSLGTQSLTVNYDPTQKHQDIELKVYSPNNPNIDNYTRAEASIVSIEIKDANGNIVSGLLDPITNVHFEVNIEIERYFKMNVKRTPRVFVGNFDANTNELEIHWDYLHGAEYYNLEWLFIDNPQSLTENFDFSKATRISTEANSYKISMAYREGVFLFRTRGVGVGESTSGVFDKRIEGNWSTPNKGTTQSGGGNMYYKTKSENQTWTRVAYVWNGLETDKNWQYNSVYAEDGKRKEVISFYDGTLKTEQTVTILNTDQHAVVAEPIFDYIGREALQILPAPQASQGIRYYDPLHYDPIGNLYSYENFDFDANITNPETLKETGNLGAGNYYSPSAVPLGNTINESYVPDAEGYPFTRTIFKNDGTGRVKEQTGIGKEFYKNNNLNHSTKFYYSAPLQSQLFCLFASEAGHANSYEKIVSVDPNGQASAAYKDLSGRVIATSLLGDAPTNLLEIDTKPDNFATFRDNLSHFNRRVNDDLVVNHSITVVGSSIYDFDYSLPASFFEDCAPPYSCVYDLEVIILNEYGAKQQFTNGDYSIIRDSINRVSPPIIFSAQLTTGSYQIVKKLTINSVAIDSARAHFIANQTCYEPAQVDTITSCFPNCEELCYSGYTTPLNAQGIQYIVDENFNRVAEVDNGDTTVYDQQGLNAAIDSIQSCIKLCNNVDYYLSNCDVKYELLADDMSPGGQYFDNLVDLDKPNYQINGWLTNSNNLSSSDINAISSCFEIPSTVNYSQDINILWNYIRNNWQADWSGKMIAYHPEWCAFQKECCAESTCEAGDLIFSYEDTCQTTIQAIQADVDAAIANTDTLAAYNAQNPVILSLEEIGIRVRSFYKEYYTYHHIKNSCPGIYLSSPDSNGLTKDSFMIRYPENYLFEWFDPNDTAAWEQMTTDNCEQKARASANRFRNELRCNSLTSSQIDQLVNFVYDQTLLDCKEDTIDLNIVIEDYITCNFQLPEQCYVHLLPDEDTTATNCECEQLYDFMYFVMNEPIGSNVSYTDIITPPSYASNVRVQDALDLFLTGSDLALKPNFINWVTNCEQYNNWYGTQDTSTYKLASNFICDSTSYIPDTLSGEECAAEFNAFRKEAALKAFEKVLQREANAYVFNYIDSCLYKASLGERFIVKYEFNEYHFTLYYYDQAGNLIKTDPPESLYQKHPVTGIELENRLLTDQNDLDACWNHLNDTANYPFVYTEHMMTSSYQYNSLNNIIIQRSPDGGITEFWYDALGRLVVSQNANQKIRNAYSYLLYDELGRTTEAGELVHTTPMTKEVAEDTTDFNDPLGNNDLLTWHSLALQHNEISKTFYDAPPSGAPLPLGSQKNLRNRIAMITYDEDGDGAYETSSLYSYDILGNVNILHQENKKMPVGNQLKKMTYEYDLLSGNVNEVHYQPREKDAHHFKYTYDADNRLVKAESSLNEVIWKTDAKYFYYAHGPLAREELGHTKVFANDYVYNIMGWITAMNSSVLNKQFDAGKDGVSGTINENVGSDPFGFSLGYFENDYRPRDVNVSNVLIATNNAAMNAASPDLFNGNIPQMTISISDNEEQALPVISHAFQYDQLNRIKEDKPFWDRSTNLPLVDNELINAQYTGDYATQYIFDGNGNIYSLIRNGIDNFQSMDDLSYNYKYPSGYKEDNKLYSVDDAVIASPYDLDLEDQTNNNYNYDEIGRLIQDKKEDIVDIEWNVSNKVTAINRVSGSSAAELKFQYGPMGNRIGKEVTTNTGVTTTYYLLDAQGNPLAIYEYKDGDLYLRELLLYGSKRLGTRNINIKMN